MQRLLRRCVGCAALLGVLLLADAAAAAGEPSLRLTGQITDHAGVLNPEESARVTHAIERLHADTGNNLYVVYVRSFDDSSPSGWATRTAGLSQLGHADVLLAVAVSEHAYEIYYDYTSSIDPQRADTIATEDVGPRLAGNDWSGAAVELADRLGTTNDVPTGVVVGASILGLVVLGGGAFLLVRRRSRRAATAGAAPLAAPPVDGVGRARPAPVDDPDDPDDRARHELAAPGDGSSADALDDPDADDADDADDPDYSDVVRQRPRHAQPPSDDHG